MMKTFQCRSTFSFVLMYIFISQNAFPQDRITIDKVNKDGINENNIKINSMVPLETEPDSFLGDVSDIQIDGTNIFLLDKNSQVLKRFNNNGKYLNQIGRSGKGPGEYGRLFSFCLVPEKKIVVISDQTGKSLKYYNYDGDHVKEVHIGASAKKVIAISGNTIICHHGRMAYLGNDGGNLFELVAYDMNGGKKFWLFPFKKARYFDLLPGLEKHPSGNSAIYYKAFDYNIYQISETSQIESIYYFDFKHNNADTSKFTMEGAEGLMNLSKLKNEVLGFSEINMTDKILSMKIHSDEETSFLVLDRKTKKWENYLLDESGYAGSIGSIPIPAAREVFNDQLVGIIYPQDIFIESQLQGITIKQSLEGLNYKGDINKISIEDNPILIFYEVYR